MSFLSSLFKRTKSNLEIIQEDYDKAIKSNHLQFIQEVLDRYAYEIGNDEKYHQL